MSAWSQLWSHFFVLPLPPPPPPPPSPPKKCLYFPLVAQYDIQLQVFKTMWNYTLKVHKQKIIFPHPFIMLKY